MWGVPDRGWGALGGVPAYSSVGVVFLHDRGWWERDAAENNVGALRVKRKTATMCTRT
jgi:hypothetical protein